VFDGEASAVDEESDRMQRKASLAEDPA
jgi:hypothetical protein